MAVCPWLYDYKQHCHIVWLESLLPWLWAMIGSPTWQGSMATSQGTEGELWPMSSNRLKLSVLQPTVRNGIPPATWVILGLGPSPAELPMRLKSQPTSWLQSWETICTRCLTQLSHAQTPTHRKLQSWLCAVLSCWVCSLTVTHQELANTNSVEMEDPSPICAPQLYFLALNCSLGSGPSGRIMAAGKWGQ